MLYTRSILEISLGAFFAIASIRAILMALVDIVALFRYWSRLNADNTGGDILAAVIMVALAAALLRDGRKVWQRARLSPA